MANKTETQEVVLFEGEETKGMQQVTYDADDNWVIVNHNGNEISLSLENWANLIELSIKTLDGDLKIK